ncbi:MAG: hypothetical protein IKF19_02165 [Bacilli bacterium]|nr:hypothetical protein [Bacilli bacterium]
MISNVSNDLKHKVINNRRITKKDANRFIEYMIDKTKIIVDRMYIKNSNYMNLFGEIAMSYNLPFEFVNSKNNGCLVNICDYIYLVDINFNSNNLSLLCKNKYIEYTIDNFNNYLKICGEKIE